MFDLIPMEVFIDIVTSHFSVLDEKYVSDLAPELLRDLSSRFDSTYRTRFVITDSEKDTLLSKNAVLTTHQTAEEFCKIIGDDKASIGILLIEA